MRIGSHLWFEGSVVVVLPVDVSDSDSPAAAPPAAVESVPPALPVAVEASPEAGVVEPAVVCVVEIVVVVLE